MQKTSQPARPSLTLRQIEVLRAIMMTGTIAGAARLLRVSAPGISRLMKYTEKSLKLRLFERRHGRYAPTPEAQDIFEQINSVYKKVDDLHYTLARIERGESVELRIGSVPSISYVMLPRAIARLQRQHPDLRLDINILKIEEAIDYILLGKGELVVMSYRLDHPGIDFLPLAQGRLVCIVPENHELAARSAVSARDMARFPLIGIEPTDPYGRIMVELFDREGLAFDLIIKARFGMTVAGLVKEGLGIAIIDEFTVAHGAFGGLKVLPITQETAFQAYIAVRADRALSRYADNLVRYLRDEMEAVARQSTRDIRS